MNEIMCGGDSLWITTGGRKENSKCDDSGSNYNG